MKLNDKVTLITGATDGIVLACAQRFSAERSRVLLVDIDVARGERATRSLREQGADAQFFGCDVGDKAQVRGAVDAAVAEWGRLDCAVAHAHGSAGRSGRGRQGRAFLGQRGFELRDWAGDLHRWWPPGTQLHCAGARVSRPCPLDLCNEAQSTTTAKSAPVCVMNLSTSR